MKSLFCEVGVRYTRDEKLAKELGMYLCKYTVDGCNGDSNKYVVQHRSVYVLNPEDIYKLVNYWNYLGCYSEVVWRYYIPLDYVPVRVS